MSMSQSVLWPFKLDAWVCSSPLFPSEGVLANFHSQILWGILFPALVLRAREPSLGLGLVTP